ncbi:MAG TPA: chemotaxis protein CheR, partial [Clostridiaceae bacterium]|nr:chemotaxis protein CheR [Clostridiaceae bacterium]
MEYPMLERYVLDEYKMNLNAYKSKQLTRRVNSFMSRSGAKNEADFVKMLKGDCA